MCHTAAALSTPGRAMQCGQPATLKTDPGRSKQRHFVTCHVCLCALKKHPPRIRNRWRANGPQFCQDAWRARLAGRGGTGVRARVRGRRVGPEGGCQACLEVGGCRKEASVRRESSSAARPHGGLAWPPLQLCEQSHRSGWGHPAQTYHATDPF